MSGTIRVLIVDDHAVVRTGLRKVLEGEDGIEVVGEAGDARNAVFQTRETKPDVILMDVVMPGKTGIEAIPDVLHDAPDAKILILSMQDDPHYVREAFDAGAVRLRAQGGGRHRRRRGDPRRRSGRALRAPGARGEDARRRRGGTQARRAGSALDRERDVLRLLALGHTNQEIASQLYISVRTAETHRAHIMQKLRITPARSSSATRSRRDCSRRRTSSRELRRGADDQHGPLRLAEEPLRHAPEQGAGNRAATARADHDQVDVMRVGEGDDLIDGVAAQQHRRRDDP
jgi:two-component system response regulator NreC